MASSFGKAFPMVSRCQFVFLYSVEYFSFYYIFQYLQYAGPLGTIYTWMLILYVQIKWNLDLNLYWN